MNRNEFLVYTTACLKPSHEKLLSRAASMKLMGILNSTPDSFFDQGMYFSLEKGIERGIAMYQEGADIIDIGGESTRPNAPSISEEEELQRVIPLIQGLKPLIPIPISIDTMKPNVASAALKAGAQLINDVFGFRDPNMRALAAEADCDICLMHMQGTPQTMQQNPHYPEGVVTHLLKWFDTQIVLLLKAGVKKERVIIDPGIGFGKSVADNLEILQNLPQFKSLGFRVLLGVSRKSFLRKIVNRPTSELLPATIAMNTVAMLGGCVDIIRVHDVKEHRDTITLLDAIKKK